MFRGKRVNNKVECLKLPVRHLLGKFCCPGMYRRLFPIPGNFYKHNYLFIIYFLQKNQIMWIMTTDPISSFNEFGKNVIWKIEEIEWQSIHPIKTLQQKNCNFFSTWRNERFLEVLIFSRIFRRHEYSFLRISFLHPE